MTITGLVLQGGGALGAFELGAIECLLDSGIKPDVVSGVSIGAINAAVLCGHRNKNPKTSLQEMWRDLTTFSLPFQPDAINRSMSLFGCPGMYTLRNDPWNLFRWTNLYDTSPLHATLERHIDFAKLKPDGVDHHGNRPPRLVLTATNVYTGGLEEFDSAEMPITPAHVQASGSLPPSFPATKAPAPPDAGGSEHLYWDGGLFDNTPLARVIDALQESPDPDKHLYVVSLFPSAVVNAPENMQDVLARMSTLAFSHKMATDVKRANKTTEMIKFVMALESLMQARPEDAALQSLRTMPGYEVIKEYGAPLKIIEVINPNANGGADFSAAGIERRRESGYQLTAEKLAEAV
jgi:predicted acylesterase/phospholipase RssA